MVGPSRCGSGPRLRSSGPTQEKAVVVIGESGPVELSTRHREVVAPGRGSAPRIALCIAILYAPCMAQLVTRVDDDLAAAVDRLVEAGVVASRSEAVRFGLEQLVDRFRRAEIGQAIARGYREHPQSDTEVAWADESSVRMIAEEPW